MIGPARKSAQARFKPSHRDFPVNSARNQRTGAVIFQLLEASNSWIRASNIRAAFSCAISSVSRARKASSNAAIRRASTPSADGLLISTCIGPSWRMQRWPDGVGPGMWPVDRAERSGDRPAGSTLRGHSSFRPSSAGSMTTAVIVRRCMALTVIVQSPARTRAPVPLGTLPRRWSTSPAMVV